MAIIGNNSTTGITTSVNTTDIAFRQYTDNHIGGIVATTDSDSAKVLLSDGSTGSWNYLSDRLEFETAGTTNVTIPSRVNKILLSASAGGGGGSVGELDGSVTPKLTAWIQRTGSFSSYGHYYYGSITYGNSSSGNKWINTGQGARVETSTDAITWTTRTHGNSSNSQFWHDGIYVNNQFVLVGYNYSVSVSTDGIAWTSRTANASVQYHTVDYADGKYCIAGDSGRILTSTDSIAWTVRTGAQNSDFRWVGYLNNAWHICGQSNNYAVSTDTIHWTKRTVPSSADNRTMSYHAGTQTYLMFKEYSYYQGTTGHGIYASTDSIVWVARTSDFGGRAINFQWRASEYVPSIQTVVACGTYVSVVSSTDTIHWTYSKSRPEENGSEPNYDIATDNNEKVLLTGQYYVMIRESSLKTYGVSGGSGGGGGAAKYEINGNDISKDSTLDITVGAGGRAGGEVHSQQWTLRTMGISFNRLEENGYPAVKYGGYWVVGSKTSASTDTIHWSARTLPPLPASTQAWGVAYGDLLLMTSSDNYFLCVSTDSIVWTLRTTSIAGNREMFYDGIGTWLVAGGPYGATPNGLVVSTDSIHWKRRTLGVLVARQTGFAFNGDDTYVLGTYNSSSAKSNGLSSSTDTIHWTLRTLGFGSLNTKKVNYSYATSNFYIVGEGNGLFASTDAIAWTKRTVPFSNGNVIYSYSTGYNQHVIGSQDGLATSTDSIHWTLRTHNFTEAGPRYIGYGDEKFMVSNAGSPGYKNEIAILDVSGQKGEDTTISWKGKGRSTNLTVNGNVAVNTTTKPTGASSSYYFDGTNDYLTISNASALSGFSGDFTIEFWFKGPNQTGFAVFLETYVGSNGQRWAIQAESGGTTNMIWVRDGSVKFTTSGIDALDDAWHHHAVVRDGSTITYYIDGVSRGSETFAGTLTSCTDFIIGTYSQSTSAYEINGYLSNVRIINGEALYTAAFTPPTPDLQFINDTILLTCNGSDISALDLRQTYSVTIPGGNGANKTIGGSKLELSDIENGYSYLPSFKSSGTGLLGTGFGFGVNGSSGKSTSASSASYQSPGGGGAGGSALYPASGTGGKAQNVYFGATQQPGTQPSGQSPGHGTTGFRLPVRVYGSGGSGGSSSSSPQIGVFSMRTFYSFGGISTPRMTGKYIDYLGLFVLALNNSNTKANTHLQVSTDSIHWKLRTYPFPGSNPNSNWTSRGEISVPLDTDGTQVLLSNTDYNSGSGNLVHTLAVSTDTIHWKLRTNGHARYNANNIRYGNNIWVQTYNDASSVSTSTDTIIWTMRTGPSGIVADLVYGNGRWVSTVTNGASPFTSTDAIHWKARTAPLSNSYMGQQVTYAEPSDGENIFFYGNYNNVTWSTDGISWMSRTQNQMHYPYCTLYSSTTNEYLIQDLVGRIWKFDASGPLESLFPANTPRISNISNGYYNYHLLQGKKINVSYQANGSSYYGLRSNIMSLYLGNGGNGGPGAGGGGASIISKSSLSGHGGDGGDGSVYINMI